MKLRVKNNTLRLRLTQTEVRTFAGQGTITAETTFPAGALLYSLQRSSNEEEITAALTQNSITIYVPEHIAHQWTETEEVGFEATINNGTEAGLQILVEKDFACLIPRKGEDEADHFPNPAATN